MFRDAKVGDRVWSMHGGWSTIVGINCGAYPIQTKADQHICDSFTFDGKRASSDLFPSLFWDEVKIVPPPKPKRKVKKTIEGYLRFFEGTGGNLILADKLAENPVGPGSIIPSPGRHCRYLGEQYIRHEYEVEE